MTTSDQHAATNPTNAPGVGSIGFANQAWATMMSIIKRAEANLGALFDMRSIDIFVSSCSDVQQEQAVAEQLIRSAAAEFNLG